MPDVLKLALLVRLEAKPGKERDVERFLEAGLQLANQEERTRLWFALQLGPTTYGVFDAFTDEAGRQAHLDGPIAAALMERAPDLFMQPPLIEPVELIGVKVGA